MGRPQSMCEIIHPKGGKLGKYRTMFQGKYYIFRAAGKSDAWGMFHKELADSGKLTDEEVLRVGAALSRTVPTKWTRQWRLTSEPQDTLDGCWTE